MLMKPIATCAAICLVQVATYRSSCAAELPAAEKAAGFVSLFDGQKLAGWREPTDGYAIENGELVCRRGHLYTAKQYTNFVLRFEFKLPPGGNNGIGIRTPLTGNPAYAGMEIQVLDNSAERYAKLKPYQYHGSIYGVVPAKRGALKPVGEWNSEEIVAAGSHIKVTVNDQVIVDADVADLKPKHAGLHRQSGHIALLGHNSPVRFRNIRVRELPADR
jgi:hypothetical protein